jgi:formylglycine-generating enzyme
MVLVDGDYCPAVAHFCAEWIGEDRNSSNVDAPNSSDAGAAAPGRRCRRYDDRLICEGRPAHLHVCVDRYEYPNLRNAVPAILVTYREAAAACAVEGKRLCEADEWILACEGPKTWPYPYGIERAPGACNVDRAPRPADRAALATPADVSLEVERLDQRVPSGSSPRCASPFGAFDMSGNAAEWVHERHGRRGVVPSDTALAGGDWERTSATCRRVDARFGPDHSGLTTGFRCCADALDHEPARRMLPEGRRLPNRRPLL